VIFCAFLALVFFLLVSVVLAGIEPCAFN